MVQPTKVELAIKEQLQSLYPGMSDKDGFAMARSAATVGIYKLGPDSLEREGTAKGTLMDGSIVSRIYPGSTHPYKVYIPADYNADQAYPFIIFLDGITYYLSADVYANNVLDNLIADHRIPSMIAIFLEPGDKGDGMPVWGGAYDMPISNRSKEYDSVDDVFVRFLLEEVLPEISKSYSLTSDPNLRCLCGASSGAQAAFNAAWHRPDQFRKVISHIGSFIDMRGGDCNPVRIRKDPPKPIRVFLQDGENDANISYGDLVLANKTMASALEYSGYDYKYVLGKGGHNFEHCGAILPETLEWIWRD